MTKNIPTCGQFVQRYLHEQSAAMFCLVDNNCFAVLADFFLFLHLQFSLFSLCKFRCLFCPTLWASGHHWPL